MSAGKFWKKTAQITPLEEKIANILIDIERKNTDKTKNLKNMLLDSVKEVEIICQNSQVQKKLVVITVPFVCHKILNRIVKFLTVEIEQKLNQQVFFILKRKIDSKWIKSNKSQMRPRSHTLTSVFDNILDDLCSPAVIIGKRFRCRVDGSKLFKIHLDEKEREFMQNRVQAIQGLYKQITKRELNFEFRTEHSFYSTKK